MAAQSFGVRVALPPSVIFASVMFTSAALIFVLQPMFARMATPLLGGAPAVWNTSMVFFQAALLIGYLYAHGLQRLRALELQIASHAAVLIAGCAALAIGGFAVDVSGILGAPRSDAPIPWLLGTLAVSVGAPYAALSATAPLLQAWYARSGAPDAHDPYYLYAASNLGSLIGLAAYPTIIEPTLGLSLQAQVWAWGFAFVAIGILAAGVNVRGAGRTESAVGSTQDPSSASPSWRSRLFWLGAAAVPSSLLLGVTNHIATDVASAPFLWVAPLALYLLTFVIAFGRGAVALQPIVALLQPISLAALLVAMTSNGFWLLLPTSLVCFFLSALLCHLALAQARPPARHLTEFYLYVSLGGVLGGAATALVAPSVFNDVYEYPLALAAAALFLPRRKGPVPMPAAIALLVASLVAAVSFALREGALDFDTLAVAGGIVGLGLLVVAASGPDELSRPAGLVLSAGATASALLLLLWQGGDGALSRAEIVSIIALGGAALLVFIGRSRQLMREATTMMAVALVATILAVAASRLGLLGSKSQLSFMLGGDLIIIVIGVTAAALLANRGRPYIAAALVLAAFAALHANATQRGVIFQDRSFFGVTRVIAYNNVYPDGVLRVMMHGTTIHGAQFASGSRVAEPLTYYHPDTGLGSAILAAVKRHARSNLGVIGLGTGSSACLARPSDAVTIFEIDPMVVEFSIGQGREGVFSYVPRCAPDAKVVLGDARLGMANYKGAPLDALVVDAFSSDAVPAHLLTREAIALYLSKMTPDGVVILHLSNRNLDLVNEAARVARAGGWGALWANTEGSSAGADYTSFSTTVMVIGRDQAVVDALALGDQWQPAPDLPGRAWTDEYINLIRPLAEKFDR